MSPPHFVVDRKEDLGIPFELAVVAGVQVRRESPELNKWKRQKQRELRDLDSSA